VRQESDDSASQLSAPVDLALTTSDSSAGVRRAAGLHHVAVSDPPLRVLLSVWRN
jgi:hypothetical protein